MTETAQTMTEFTYAPGEKNIFGEQQMLDRQRQADDSSQASNK